jgi:hypothetical protein
MQRVLDLDLDFFVENPAHWQRKEGGRLDPEGHRVWPIDEALAFLRDRCSLEAALPGAVVEHHGELFGCWRSAIESSVLKPPFSVVHIDAHADLGFGDNGYVYLMTSLLYCDLKDRSSSKIGRGRVEDGNYLAFAIACRWISTIEYVFPPGGGDDVLRYFKQGFRRHADHLQLAAMRPSQLKLLRDHLPLLDLDRDPIPWTLDHVEPPVSFALTRYQDLAKQPLFDFIFLARSPEYTPLTADPLFDRIRCELIDEAAFLDALQS